MKLYKNTAEETIGLHGILIYECENYIIVQFSTLIGLYKYETIL